MRGLDGPSKARASRAIFRGMTDKRLPRPRDPVQLGKLIGDILTGQVEDRAAAAQRSQQRPRRRGPWAQGRIEGRTGAGQSLTPSERKKIAQNAAKKRWEKDQASQPHTLVVRSFRFVRGHL